MLTKEEKEIVMDVVEQEGFDYAFAHYSDFSEIDDNEFHELKDRFLQARHNLVKYAEIDNA